MNGDRCCDVGTRKNGQLRTSAEREKINYAEWYQKLHFDFIITDYYRACTCARVCAVCSLALGNEGGRGSASHTGHLLLASDIVIPTRNDGDFVCIYFI